MALEDILSKIAKLIERADHAGTGEAEREACLDKANAMMTKYAIDQAMLEMSKPAGSRELPTSVDIAFVKRSSDWYNDLTDMLTSVGHIARVKIAIRPDWSRPSTAILVGFQSDIDYARMIWNSIYFTFISKLDPSWDPQHSADENIKILKEAGRKWAEIAEAANRNGFECTPNDGRLKAAYRRQCAAEGVEPTSHTSRHAAYRAAYAEGFRDQIRLRVRRQMRAAEDQVNAGDPGTALVLADRYGDVDSKFYEMFPSLRPWTDAEWAKFQADMAAKRTEEEAAYANMTDAQKAAYDRRKAREDRAAQNEWERQNARKQDAAGRAAGTSAANLVDLGGAKVGSESRKGIDS